MWGRRVRLLGALLALTLAAARTPEAHDEPLPGWFDLEVPGGETTLTALNFTLDERAFTLSLLARALHDRDVDSQLTNALAQIEAAARESGEITNVPAPLDADTWRDLLPPVKPPATRDLFLRILRDRNALLLAAGLTATHDSVRAFFTRERETLRAIYQHGAGGFALAARRLRIDNGRVIVPGGPSAARVWESLAGASPNRPAAFVRALVTKDHGRLAWYFDALGELDAEQMAAAWPVANIEHAQALYSAFREPDVQWRPIDQPFRRTAVDAWMILKHTEVADGAAASPLPHATWAMLFTNTNPSRGQAAQTLRGENARVSLAWLARETLSPVLRERRSRYEMFRVAQRVFRDAPREQRSDVAYALSGVRSHRALMLTLERMQIRDPATWATMLDAARHVTNRANNQRVALPAFQATVALLERMRHAHTLDVPTAAKLLRSLSDAVRVDEEVTVSLGRWLTSTLVPALPPLVRPDAFTARTAYESTILQALAGPARRDTPAVAWEGLAYVVDPVAAEHERLRRTRAMLPSPGLDAALAGERPRELADALTALVYATALGDPEGPASLSPDIASRHDFGLNGTAIIRDELPWSPPEERQGIGTWRVQGSLLGLDLGLSRLFLRRIADQQMPPQPTLTLNDLSTLTRTGVLLGGRTLQDQDRDEIAAAIARGRQRVADAASVDELVALARECRMSDAGRELLPWIASRQRDAVATLFSLRELLWLGKPALTPAQLDAWGAAAEGIDGRRVLAMPGVGAWEDYAGRSEVGQMTTQVPDLTLRLIEETARLRLPASLVPSMLAFALQDYWHDVRARFTDDWPRLTRQAAMLSPTRIQDYVAALAGGGPLRAQSQ